jgi:hypothetical protein
VRLSNTFASTPTPLLPTRQRVVVTYQYFGSGGIEPIFRPPVKPDGAQASLFFELITEFCQEPDSAPSASRLQFAFHVRVTLRDPPRVIMRTIEDVLNRLRAEFVEMPGLRLTSEQVQRLCGIEPTICRLVLASLVGERFLSLNSDGRYARFTDEAYRPPTRREAIVAAPMRGDQQLEDFAPDWPTRPNVHFTGPADAVELSLAALRPYLAPSVCWWTLDAPLPSSQGVKTLVIRNVDRLTAEQQRALLSWLEQTAAPTHVVSTATVPLFPRVTAGLFLDVLYYRLNTVMLFGANTAVTDDAGFPRPHPAKADFGTDLWAKEAS